MDKKIWTYVLGGLLIGFGVVFILSPTEAFESIVMTCGIVLIVYNVIKIIGAIKSDNPYASFGITGSIIGIVFGFILIGNKEIAIKVIPVILGIWLLVTGLTTLLFTLKTSANKNMLTKPVIKIILGAVTLLLPVIPVIASGIVLGIILVLSGVTTITNAKDEEVIYKVKVKK